MIEFSTFVSAVATVAIAFLAWKTNQLTSAIRQKDAEHQQEIKDLFRAIVISNLLLSETQGPDSGWVSDRIKKFKQMYSGSTQIFN